MGTRDKVGRAYGLIAYDGSIEELEAEVAGWREKVSVPNTLDITCIDGPGDLNLGLVDLLMKNLNYQLAATQRYATNEEVAHEVAAILAVEGHPKETIFQQGDFWEFVE